MTSKRELLTLLAWLTAAALLAALTWRVQAATGPMAADANWANTVAAMRSQAAT